MSTTFRKMHIKREMRQFIFQPFTMRHNNMMQMHDKIHEMYYNIC